MLNCFAGTRYQLPLIAIKVLHENKTLILDVALNNS